MSLNLQSRRCARVIDVVQRQSKRPQWTSCPSLADFTKQPMFDGIPFRGARRIMTHRYRQAQTIGNLHLQLLSPQDAAPLSPFAPRIYAVMRISSRTFEPTMGRCPRPTEPMRF